GAQNRAPRGCDPPPHRGTVGPLRKARLGDLRGKPRPRFPDGHIRDASSRGSQLARGLFLLRRGRTRDQHHRERRRKRLDRLLLLVQQGRRGRDFHPGGVHRSLGFESVRADALLFPGDFGAGLDGRATHDARSPQRGVRDSPNRVARGPRRSSVVRRDLRGGGDPRRCHDRPREPPRETPGGDGPETLTPRSYTGRGGWLGGPRYRPPRERPARRGLRFRPRTDRHRDPRVPTDAGLAPGVPRLRLRRVLREGPAPDDLPLRREFGTGPVLRPVRLPRSRDPRPVLRVHAPALSSAWPRTRTSWRWRPARTSTISSVGIPGSI